MSLKSFYNHLISDSNSESDQNKVSRERGQRLMQNRRTRTNDEYSYEKTTLTEVKPEKPEIKIIEVTDFDTVYKISDLLKQNLAIIVNLDKLKKDDTNRAFQFINGASYYAKGTLTKISDNVYLVTPPSFEVSEQQAESERKKTTATKRKVNTTKTNSVKPTKKDNPKSESKSDTTIKSNDDSNEKFNRPKRNTIEK